MVLMNSPWNPKLLQTPHDLAVSFGVPIIVNSRCHPSIYFLSNYTSNKWRFKQKQPLAISHSSRIMSMTSPEYSMDAIGQSMAAKEEEQPQMLPYHDMTRSKAPV